MSLYDGLETEVEKDKTEKDISGWSSGIKLLQSQLQLKNKFLTQTKIAREPAKKGSVMLPPVIDLKSRKEPEERVIAPASVPQNRVTTLENRIPLPIVTETFNSGDQESDIVDEYDPLYPNDYEKIIKDQRERKEKEREEERRREYEERRRRNSERYHERDEADRNKDRRKRSVEEEEEYEKPKRPSSGGAAIAPPTSLLEGESRRENNSAPTFGANIGRGGSVALKIMAKYGFKEGQGLGKQEQGMSQALQVEKTSKRGGKIIHERDVPKVEPLFVAPAPLGSDSASATSPQNTDSITEAMKNPSKVVLLRNMVGPGEVDDDLEPEVKDECSKYGEVFKCVIFEIPSNDEEEAIRIFVEFKRIESAIKAVVDLNGRYFGGRIVKAGFYNLDKFRRLDLGD